jgi:aryl-alcohol dehydrogenase-like predicted oxidoreductase
VIYRQLGQSEIEVSVVGMGTWAIGGTWWGGAMETESVAALRAGLDAGINLIDTAPVYGFGLAEEVVGKAIKGRDRDSVVIATKVGLVWDNEVGRFFFEDNGTKVYRNLKPESIRREVENSLRRLDVDYIDLYQTHWQDPTTPISDTMSELLKLKDEGKIKAIGVSNASISDMLKYLDLGRIESNQPLYNMLDRSIEGEELPFCQEHDIAVLSYSSLALGLLTGKLTGEKEYPSSDPRSHDPRYGYEPIAKINQMLEQFAPFRNKYGLNQTQLTIAWTHSRLGITSALVGVRTAAHAEENAAAGYVLISQEDIAEMDKIIKSVELL